MAAHSTIYVRVKRRQETYCFLMETDDPIKLLHSKLQAVWRQHAPSDTNDDDYRLIYKQSNDDKDKKQEEVLILEKDSTQTLQECNIGDQAIIYLLRSVSDEEYESIDVASTEWKQEAATA